MSGRDRITANLPSRDFAATSAFYARLGFTESWRDDGWMILRRGALELEFFPHPECDPFTSWFSACVRVDDPDALYAAWAEAWQQAGLPRDRTSIPRMTGFFKPGEAPRMFAMIDLDGTLLRCMGND